MVINTSRPTDFADIRKAFLRAGKDNKLLRAAPSSEQTLNIGRFFTSGLPGGSPRLLAQVLTMASQILNRSSGGGKESDFWQGFFTEAVLMSAHLAILSEGGADLDVLYDIILS